MTEQIIENSFPILNGKISHEEAAMPLMHLNAASFESVFEGLYGASAASYFKALKAKIFNIPGSFQTWNALMQAAVKTRNAATAVRALFEASKRVPHGHAAADMHLFAGHILRSTAGDYPESARSYAKSCAGGRDDAMAGIIALQRLCRCAPQCDEARAALENARRNCDFDSRPKECIESELSALDPEDYTARARTMIDLAAALLIGWGDAGSALDWLENAAQIETAACERLNAVTAAAARAYIDDRPTLTRAVHILHRCRADDECMRISDMAACISGISPGCVDLIFAEICARKGEDDRKTAHFLRRAAAGIASGTDRQPWKCLSEHNAWLFAGAASRPILREAFFDILRNIDEPETVEQMLAELSRRAGGDTAARCMAMRVRIACAAGNPRIAADIFLKCLEKDETPTASRLRIFADILLDLTAFSEAKSYAGMIRRAADIITACSAVTEDISEIVRKAAGEAVRLSGDRKHRTLVLHGIIPSASELPPFPCENQADIDARRALVCAPENTPIDTSVDDILDAIRSGTPPDEADSPSSDIFDFSDLFPLSSSHASPSYSEKSRVAKAPIIPMTAKMPGKSPASAKKSFIFEKEDEAALKFQTPFHLTAASELKDAQGYFRDGTSASVSAAAELMPQEIKACTGKSDILRFRSEASAVCRTPSGSPNTPEDASRPSCPENSARHFDFMHGPDRHASSPNPISAQENGQARLSRILKSVIPDESDASPECTGLRQVLTRRPEGASTTSVQKKRPIPPARNSSSDSGAGTPGESGIRISITELPGGLSAGSSTAGPPEDGSSGFDEAVKLAENGHFDEAISLFFEKCTSGQNFDKIMEQLTALDAKAILCDNPVQQSETVCWEHPERQKNSVRALALAAVADSSGTAAPWLEWLAQKAGGEPEKWKCAADTLLRYIQYSKHQDSIIDVILSIFGSHLPAQDAVSVFIGRMPEAVQYDAVFEQVLDMSENINQRQMLEKLDAAIAMYEGDASQKSALLAKKYKIADMLGDERIKMTCLRDILEISSNDEFAIAELRKLHPEVLRPHAQILYYQLLIYIDTNAELRLRHQMKLAAIYARSSQFNNAINLYYAVIDEHPEYVEARLQLLELLESQENWKSAENILLALINEETTDQTLRVQCLIRLADIQFKHMLMPLRALLTLFSAIDADPMKLNSLHERLCEISEHAKSYAALLDKYEDIANNAKTYEVRRMATVLLANVCAERIHKEKLACSILDDFYEHEGRSDPEFLQVVSNFFADIQNWEGYTKVTTSLIPLTADPNERAVLAVSVAQIQSTQFMDSVRAAQYARLAAQAGPKSPEIWHEIADFLIQNDALRDALDALSQAEAAETSPENLRIILFKMTHIYTQLDCLEEAAALFHRITGLEPPLEQLTPIAEDLIALATAHKDKDTFVRLCGDLVKCCPESEQTALRLQQALTLIRIFDDEQIARRIIEESSLQIDRLDAEQSFILAQIFTLLGQNRDAADIAQKALQNFAFNDEQRYECLQTLLTNALDLNDTALVHDTALEILRLDPDESNANFSLIQLCYHTGKWDEAAERIQKFLPHLERLSAENAMLLHYYYGEILHAAQNTSLAIECLDNALRIRTDFRPAVDLKLTILLENERWPEALPLFELLLSLTEDVEVRGAIHKRIAELHHFYLHNKETAIHQYEIALELGGDVEDVPIRLLQLYQETESWQKAAMTAQVLAMAQVNSPSARASYLFVLGEIQAGHLNDISGAVNALLEAFILEPSSAEILKLLTKLLVRQKDAANLTAIFEHLCAHIAEDRTKITENIVWIARAAASCEQCRPAIEKAARCLEKFNIHLDLLKNADQNPISLDDVEIDMPRRRRVNTSPRGSLTVDSSLIRNPEHKPASDKKQTSIITGRPAVANLPDDAILPLDSPASAEAKAHVSTKDGNAARDSKQKTTAPGRLPRLGNSPAGLPALGVIGRSAMIPFENLTFTADTLIELKKTAENVSAQLTAMCINDMLDLAGQPHDMLRTADLPDEVPVTVIQNLYAPKCTALTPGLEKMLTALAAPGTPGMPEFPTADDFRPTPECAIIFEKLSKIFRVKDVVLKKRTVTGEFPVIIARHPVILCSESDMQTPQSWTAHIARCLVLARPETRLLAAMPPVDVLEILTDASAAMRPVRSKAENLGEDTVSAFKSLLIPAGLTPASMPRISRDTLSALRTIAEFNCKTAIRCAFIFSQSFLDCLKILTDLEEIRFPTTIAMLKSAMKQSQMIRDFVCFAIGPNAQRLYARIFS